MRCHAVICSECTTRIDGINHCARCLRGLHAAASAPARSSLSAASWRSLSLGLLFAAAVLLIGLLTLHLGGG